SGRWQVHAALAHAPRGARSLVDQEGVTRIGRCSGRSTLGGLARDRWDDAGLAVGRAEIEVGAALESVVVPELRDHLGLPVLDDVFHLARHFNRADRSIYPVVQDVDDRMTVGPSAQHRDLHDVARNERRHFVTLLSQDFPTPVERGQTGTW